MGGFTIPLRFNLAAKYKIEGSTVNIQSNLKFPQAVIKNYFRKQLYHTEAKHCLKAVAINSI